MSLQGASCHESMFVAQSIFFGNAIFCSYAVCRSAGGAAGHKHWAQCYVVSKRTFVTICSSTVFCGHSSERKHTYTALTTKKRSHMLAACRLFYSIVFRPILVKYMSDSLSRNLTFHWLSGLLLLILSALKVGIRLFSFLWPSIGLFSFLIKLQHFPLFLRYTPRVYISGSSWKSCHLQ